MALSIKNARAEDLARAVAAEAGETRTQAVITALEERLERLRGRRSVPDVYSAIMEIASHCAALPELSDERADDLLGYRADGTFDG